MSWNPILRNVPQPIPTCKYLEKAVWKLYMKKIISFPKETLKDAHGRYGFRFGNFIVVAKEKPYGNILSVHEDAVLKAIKFKVYIALWLDSANKFYKIDPYEIMKESEMNWKGTACMRNFSIKLCQVITEWE